MLGLIGESGAGKSTIGLAALGYIRPGCAVTAGRIVFDGQDLATLTPAALRAIRGARVAYVAQSAAASFNPARRLGQQVAEALVLHRATDWTSAHRQAAALFEELDLPAPGSFGERYPHQVSGGQLQRAMIAMAMACEPGAADPRRADDRARRDDADRGACRRAEHAAPARLRRPLHHPRSRRGGAARRPAGRAAARAPGGNRNHERRSSRLRYEDYTRRLVAARIEPDLPPIDTDLEATPPTLAVKALSASYRTMPNVLSDVSFTLRPGETLAIVGTSGSGKSTLARVICGLMPQQSGTVEFRAESLPTEVRKRTREQLRRLQMIYQLPDTALNPRQKVGRILGRAVSFYFGGSRASVQHRVDELLDMVGLPRDFAHRRPGELSGGQKQRVCIARALAAKPDVIFCDEVTSALDPLVAEEILALLQRLQHADAGRLRVHHARYRRGAPRRHRCGGHAKRPNRRIRPDLESFCSTAPSAHAAFARVRFRRLRTDWLTGILREREDAAQEL